MYFIDRNKPQSYVCLYCAHDFHNGLHNAIWVQTCISVAIRINEQNTLVSCHNIGLRNILYVYPFFFSDVTLQRMYVIVEIDRVPEEARDVSTWIRVPLTVYACILREAVGVRAGLRRVTQGSSACFTRHKTPTILAKSPAKSLLLITRQREYHGQGILLFIMM